MATFEANFDLAEKVIIDGCPSIVALVTNVGFTTEGTTYRISWVAEGRIQWEWVDEWRLSKWEE